MTPDLNAMKKTKNVILILIIVLVIFIITFLIWNIVLSNKISDLEDATFPPSPAPAQANFYY
jgi:flagellar basal body-associated protein FliL